MPEASVPCFLVAEPDETIAEVLCDILMDGFPGCDVTLAECGKEAWRIVRTGDCDLAIMEAHLSGATGEWVLRQIRGTARKLPVIMTAAHATEDLEARLLDLGADDFLHKPFSMIVLLRRVGALLRRVPPNRRTHTHVGELRIGHHSCTVRLNGQSAQLTRLEHGVLAALARRQGEVVPTAHLMDRVWDRDTSDIGVLYVVVHSLRKKLNRMGLRDPLRNHKGVGYTLVLDGRTDTFPKDTHAQTQATARRAAQTQAYGDATAGRAGGGT